MPAARKSSRTTSISGRNLRMMSKDSFDRDVEVAADRQPLASAAVIAAIAEAAPAQTMPSGRRRAAMSRPISARIAS